MFIKWLTASEQNMRFISSTGYLPVTRQGSFETDMDAHIASVEDARIKRCSWPSLRCTGNTAFFTPPNFAAFDDIGKSMKNASRPSWRHGGKLYLDGRDTGRETALAEMRK